MKRLACLPLLVSALLAQDFAGSARLDETVERAVKEGQIPGAVLLIGHQGRTARWCRSPKP
jgi:hypothetical protein